MPMPDLLADQPQPQPQPPPPSQPPVLVDGIEAFIIQALQDLPLEPPHQGRGRPRVLPALALWGGLLLCLVRGFSSQLALWRLLQDHDFFWHPRSPVSDQALYNRLHKAGLAPLQTLFSQISALLRERLDPYVKLEVAPFATEVVALDETNLDQTARLLPALRGLEKGHDELLPGKLAATFDLRRQQWLKIEHTPAPHQNSKVLARSMLEGLPLGSLVLADLGYFGFEWFDDLTTAGYYWVSRLRAKTSTKVIHAFYHQGDTFDGLVWLGAYRADQAQYAVRLVQFRQGQTLYRYVTNVREPTQLPMLEVARLYARRWDTLMAFKTLKQHLNLHLLWSAKPVIILQQVWGVLIIAQILQALQMEIAAVAGADPFEVSLALLVDYLPQFARTGQNPLTAFVEGGRHLRFIRPSRRTVIVAPVIPLAELNLPPPELILTRPPRYAQRRC